MAEVSARTPAEAVDAYITGAKAKVRTPLGPLAVKAILAGAMIALGAAGSQAASHAVSNAGLAKLTAGVLFPMGLMMVVLTGAELFTGDCLLGMAAVRKEITWGAAVRVLAVAYVGNLIGAVCIAALVFAAGQLNLGGGALAAAAIRTAAAKCSLHFGAAFASGVLCNVLVCAAVMLALCARDVTGKLLSCFFLVALFVVSGYEHCVANMFYIPLGLLAAGDASYAETFGSAIPTALSLGGMLLRNLLPVTLGNLAGGMLAFGLPLAYTTKKR